MFRGFCSVSHTFETPNPKLLTLNPKPLSPAEVDTPVGDSCAVVCQPGPVPEGDGAFVRHNML